MRHDIFALSRLTSSDTRGGAGVRERLFKNAELEV